MPIYEANPPTRSQNSPKLTLGEMMRVKPSQKGEENCGDSIVDVGSLVQAMFKQAEAGVQTQAIYPVIDRAVAGSKLMSPSMAAWGEEVADAEGGTTSLIIPRPIFAPEEFFETAVSPDDTSESSPTETLAAVGDGNDLEEATGETGDPDLEVAPITYVPERISTLRLYLAVGVFVLVTIACGVAGITWFLDNAMYTDNGTIAGNVVLSSEGKVSANCTDFWKPFGTGKPEDAWDLIDKLKADGPVDIRLVIQTLLDQTQVNWCGSNVPRQ